jgi:hypothetical protein
MASRTNVEDRLSRLERLAFLSVYERHGLALGGAGVDVQSLRQQAIRDAADIAREQREPALETRAA